ASSAHYDIITTAVRNCCAFMLIATVGAASFSLLVYTINQIKPKYFTAKSTDIWNENVTILFSTDEECDEICSRTIYQCFNQVYFNDMPYNSSLSSLFYSALKEADSSS